MPLIPGYAHDIFVSYAHFDNDPDSQDIRWVNRFQADLNNALRQRLGREPAVFFDTRNFEAPSHVDFLIENVRKSAIFVAVLSPSYVAREFTRRELQAFCERREHFGSVVTVELLPVEDARNLAQLRGRKRTPFWRRGADEHGVALKLTPKFDGEMYHERVQVLAQHIRNLIERMSAVASPQGNANETIVLLAQTTDDLFDDAEGLRAYLEQYGVKILPEADYPQGGADFAAAFAADLARARVFVQLLGPFSTRKPPDLPLTYAQFQYDAARGAGLKILQWRRPDLDLATIAHRDKILLDGRDAHAVGLEEFKAEVLRACRAPAPAPTPAPDDGDFHVFINADRSDKELADQLLALFEGEGAFTAARPLYEGAASDILTDLEANLAQCQALLMLYGHAPPAWVRAQMLRFAKLEKRRERPPKRKTLLLGPPPLKSELGWSGGFEKIDCQTEDVAARVRKLIAELRT